MSEHAPLDGVTVLNLAINLPGPLAAASLSELGAHVIKVEPPAGDPLGHIVPAYYQELSAGHEILTIDLKDEAGLKRISELAAEADILITAMRPRAAESLGLPTLVERFGLVHVEIVGFGGDKANVPGHDLTYQAAHGTLIPGTTPTVPVADIVGGDRATIAAMAGLRQRGSQAPEARTGIVRRVVLDEAAAWAAGPARHGLTAQGGPLGGTSPFYRTYDTADGTIAIGCVEPAFAEALARQVGSDHETLEAAFATKPTNQWMELAATHDLPFEPVTMAASTVVIPS
ncbi:CoA transferase [Brevibacterium aurantiacum]|uniref:Carnitine dehydratase n=1 Tax=Brevibacterium aurantiacum TaxID=273384 RepID=A0A2A3X4U2_BREAU|nr:CoA transferase [Brevibacterium aurantiacum]PCC18726.1 carnitine dehydratase [Brevibacterium aurantiacum]